MSLDWSQVETFSTPHTLEVSTSYFKFRNGLGGAQALAITSNISWEITDLPDWLTVDKLSGTGGDSITITCKANPSTTDARAAEFSICPAVDDWDYRIPVYVSQVRGAEFAVPDTAEVLFRRVEGRQSVPVTSNVEHWTVSVLPVTQGESTHWITAEKNAAGDAVDISVDANYSLRRQAYVVLKTIDSETAITVTQKSLLDVTPMDIAFPSLPDKTVRVSVDTEDYFFEVLNHSSWLTVEDVSEDGFTLRASPNLSVARRATVKVIIVGHLTLSATRELTVFQEDPYNGHAYVDLGLPSGLLWATCNVGANSPEEYGSYFAWGETKPKYIYSWDSYEYFLGGDTIADNQHTNHIKFSKYNFSDSRVLDMIDDAAQENWRGIWRMPSPEEFAELCHNCTWLWAKRGSHYGIKGTSKTNGNTIFLPAAGSRYLNSLAGAGEHGCYWTNTQITSYKYESYCIYFDIVTASHPSDSSTERKFGNPVRPVCPGGECSPPQQ